MHAQENASTIVPSSTAFTNTPGIENLRVENERSTNLVRSLVELLGIKGGAEAKGDACAEDNVVGESCNTPVVDLDLGERDRV